MKWVDDNRYLPVGTNSDNPRDAKKAVEFGQMLHYEIHLNNCESNISSIFILDLFILLYDLFFLIL